MTIFFSRYFNNNIWFWFIITNRIRSKLINSFYYFTKYHFVFTS
nr:MAG TPA: hypothetical protein [Crassvirales sp.]